MSIAMLLLNFILVLICVALTLSLLGIKSKSDYILGIYIFSYANIVLVLQLSGLFSSITQITVFCLQILFFIVSILLWYFNGKPILLKPFQNLIIKKPQLKEVLLSAIKFPLLTLLIGSTVYVYLIYALKIIVVPPYNWDSLTQHLSRIGYWLQYQSFYPWPTTKLSQTMFPMNAELGILWTILWWGNDQLAGFVQWITVPVIMIGIYGLVRLLGYSRSQGVFTAFLWATLTQVLFQSSTTQNDLVVSSFWVVTVYFLFAGFKEQSRTHLYLSGIAFGLAIGAKGTSLFNLPGLLLVLILIVLFYCKAKIFHPLFVNWAATSILAFLLLGSYIYIQNFIALGNPLPMNHTATLSRRTDGSLLTAYSHRLRDNTGRFIYQLVDFSPIPFNFAERANPVKKSFFSSLFTPLGIAVDNRSTIGRSAFSFDNINTFDEDNSWYGPLMIFLIPAIIYHGIQGVRKKDVLRISLALFPIAFFVVESAVQNWTPAKGRYFMIVVALSFPLIAPLLNNSTRLQRLSRSFLVLLGIASMLTIASYTSDLGKIGWIRVLSGQRNAPIWEKVFVYQMISKSIPLDASIGVAFGGDSWDYPLFGEYFTHRVTRVLPEEKLLPRADIAQYERDFENSDFLLTSQYTPLPNADSIFDHFFMIGQNGNYSDAPGYSLWIRKDLRDECDGGKWPFANFYISSSSIVCPQFPVLIGDEIDTKSPNGDFAPRIGFDPVQYVGFSFLVRKETEVIFTISMYSGSARNNQQLQFMITGSDSKQQIFSAPFNSAKKQGDVKFVIPLKPDIYKIRLSIASGQVQSRILGIQVDAE